MFKTVGAKQGGDNSRWQTVWENIADIVSEPEIRQLVNDAATTVRDIVGDKTVGYGWSGGKDSIALRIVMDAAGIQRCVLGMTRGLEYPAFLQWATDNMPPMLDIIESPHDLEWLAANQHFLFPQDSTTAAKWFKAVQHKAQHTFVKRYNLDMILLGRRKADRNYVGQNNIYTDKDGITRYSPIADWTHEHVLAACYWFKAPMPPIYDWVNGWVVGSGNWAARQWTGSIANAWREVWSIDQTIVREAALKIESAATFLAGV